MTISITINDQAIDVPVGPDSSLGDVVNTIREEHVAQGHVMAILNINGEAWPQAQDDALATFSLEGIERIDVTTQTPGDAAQNGLDGLEEVIELIEERMGTSAEMLRGGQMTEGLEHFINGMSLMRDALQFGQLYLGHINASDAHPERQRLFNLDQELAEVLDEFNEAHQVDDWPLIADLIEFELAPRANELKLQLTEAS